MSSTYRLLFGMFSESWTFLRKYYDLSLSLSFLLSLFFSFCRNAASIYRLNRESHLRDSASRKAAYKKFKGALVLKLTSR